MSDQKGNHDPAAEHRENVVTFLMVELGLSLTEAEAEFDREAAEQASYEAEGWEPSRAGDGSHYYREGDIHSLCKKYAGGFPGRTKGNHDRPGTCPKCLERVRKLVSRGKIEG